MTSNTNTGTKDHCWVPLQPAACAACARIVDWRKTWLGRISNRKMLLINYKSSTAVVLRHWHARRYIPRDEPDE